MRLTRQSVFVEEELKKKFLPQGNFHTSGSLAKIHRFGWGFSTKLNTGRKPD
jgi:hypothetical protein